MTGSSIKDGRGSPTGAKFSMSIESASRPLELFFLFFFRRGSIFLIPFDFCIPQEGNGTDGSYFYLTVLAPVGPFVDLLSLLSLSSEIRHVSHIFFLRFPFLFFHVLPRVTRFCSSGCILILHKLARFFSFLFRSK